MIHVILNPASGARGADTSKQIADLFEAAGAHVRIDLCEPSQISAAVRNAIDMDSSLDAIVAGGGDGTVSTIASVLAGASARPLGVLPLGTLNHFAKDLHIPLDLTKAVETVLAGHAVRVDAADVNQHMFVNNASIGVYPSIVEGRERLRATGVAKWPALARATLDVLRRAEEVVVRLDTGSEQLVLRTPFVFVGNNEYEIAGIHIGARSRLDAGHLSAYVAPRVHTRDLPKLVARALIGSAHDRNGLRVSTPAELWVESVYGQTMKVACDGEVITLETPLHFRSRPGALNVIVPQAA